MKPTWRTPARRALLLAEYATATDSAGFLARVEALPGPTGGTIHGLRVWARALGLRKTPEALAAIMRDTQSRGGKARQAMLAGRPASARLRHVWTPERIALLTERYPGEGAAALVHDLGMLPGAPIAGPDAIRRRADALGVRMTREGIQRVRQAMAAARPPKPAGVAKPRPQVWLPERVALLVARYPVEGVAALLDDLRALPGLPIPGLESIRRRVKKMGLRMDTEGRRQVRKEAAAAARAEAAAARAARPRPEPRQPHAREIIAATDMSTAHRAFVVVAPPPMRRERAVVKPATVRPAPVAPAPVDPGIARYERAKRMIEQRKDPAAVAASVGLPLWRVLGIVGEVRRECRA